jgi:hypothetical protein
LLALGVAPNAKTSVPERSCERSFQQHPSREPAVHLALHSHAWLITASTCTTCEYLELGCWVLFNVKPCEATLIRGVHGGRFDIAGLEQGLSRSSRLSKAGQSRNKILSALGRSSISLVAHPRRQTMLWPDLAA